jgi:glycosyltransferase involved in cell wall biosynthesis
MVSIIIPAHNEANVIAITLNSLIHGVSNGKIEVVVVCNGCSDSTTDIVKKYGDDVQCIETSIPSKTNALNLGDEAANFYPRIYLDADIVLSVEAVLDLEKALADGRYLAASTAMKMDFGKTSWWVRSYYDVWQQLSYVKEGMVGVGVYALSEKGRGRFGKFPDVIADDGFVRASFTKKERVSVDHVYSIVRAPANLASLVKIKTRSRLGRYELALKYPKLLDNEEKKYGWAFVSLLRQERNWLKILVYGGVNVLTRLRAKKQLKQRGFSGWERDLSSRELD